MRRIGGNTRPSCLSIKMMVSSELFIFAIFQRQKRKSRVIGGFCEFRDIEKSIRAAGDLPSGAE